MRTFANMMFNTPGETEEDLNLTLECIKKIKTTELGLGLTVPFLGTPMFNEYVGDNFSREDYHLYQDPNIYSTIVDKRFKLTEHDLDVEKTMRDVYIKYILLNRVIPFTFSRWYLKLFISSKRKRGYLKWVSYSITNP